MLDPVKALIEPRRVAVLGGSNDPGKLGNFLLENLKRYGYRGEILPVHPREKRVAGLTAYPSLSEVPGSVDAALICLPAPSVAAAVEACAEKGISSAIIYACGFGEGEVAERGEGIHTGQLREIARARKIRLLGPNCMGVCNVTGHLNATFFKELPARSGGVGFISQAGSMGGILFHRLNELDVGLSKYFATGNMLDLDQTDLLLYLGRDPKTEVIALYLETVQNPARFLSEAAAVAKGKPVVVFKSARTRAGARAALSHTGNLAGENELLEAAFRRLAILQTYDTEELLDALKALSICPERLPQSRRLAIITISGGASVVGADACESKGLELTELTAESREKLRRLIPPFGSTRNPVDMTAQIRPDNYVPVVETTLADPGIDGCLAMNVNLDGVEFGEAFARAAEQGAPVVGFLLETPRILERFRRARIPVLPTPERAVSAYHALVRFAARRRRASSRQTPPPRFAPHPLLESGTGLLDEVNTKKILADHGIPVIEEEVVFARDEGAQKSAAERLGYPVTLKILEPGLPHKADSGGVLLGLKDAREVARAAATLRARFGDHAKCVIQRMATPGMEWILGIRRAPGFPPAILCGGGGVLSDLLKDVSIRLCPIDAEDAYEMIDETRASRLLSGWRCGEPLDRSHIVEVLLRLSEIALVHPRLQELDINPFILSATEGRAVDALAVLEEV